MTGVFITFEGPEGAGKTSQARRLQRRLEERGLPVLVTREPGGTKVAEALRALVLFGEPLPRTEALLFLAARAEHTERTLRPALRQGRIVLCDRFSDSTIAYQGFGLGLDIEALRGLSAFATGGLAPDLTLLLDLPPELGLERRLGVALDERRGAQLDLGLSDDEETRQKRQLSTTRIEARDLAFHRRVRQGFLAQAEREPDRILKLDGTLPKDELSDRVWQAVSQWLCDHRPALWRQRREEAG